MKLAGMIEPIMLGRSVERKGGIKEWKKESEKVWLFLRYSSFSSSGS
jgi:hypothetical protein